MAYGPEFLGGITTIIIIAAFNWLIQLKTWMLMLISAFKARLINTIETWVSIKAQLIRFYELRELTGVMRLFPNLAPVRTIERFGTGISFCIFVMIKS